MSSPSKTTAPDTPSRAIAPPAWRVATADWLDLPAHADPASIDLLYADPPFNTGRRHDTPPSAHRAARLTAASFPDHWPSMADYIAWLRARLLVSIPLLAPTANILIHTDWRTTHHVRLLLDDILGPDRFVNHLIWTYGLGGSSPRRFARKHDDILFYAADPRRYYFEPPLVPSTSRRMNGKPKKATDVLDIPAINNMAAERTGYPTQKPLELLSLLVRACSPPGGLVVDPCAGSGTTLVAAVAAGRRALGLDINPHAVSIARERLGLLRPI